MYKPCRPGTRIYCQTGYIKPSQDPNALTIDSLPNELLYLILNNLTLMEKIGVERVCKKWSEVLNSLYLKHNSLRVNNGWSLGHYDGCSERKHNERNGDFILLNKDYNIWTTPNDIDRQLFEPIVKRCPNLRSIQLENCRIDSQAFIWVLDMCPNLECLSLIEVTGFDATEWAIIVDKLGQRLKHFAISDCHDIYSESLIPIIGSLEELTVLYHSSPMSELLANLGPNIRKLSVKCCEDSNIDTIRSLAAGKGQLLTHLTIDDPWIEDEIQTLELVCRHLQNLEYLSIGFGSLTSAIRPIVELKKLRQLELNASLERWNNMLGLTLANVEYLLLNIYFSPKELVGIEKIFPKLRKFILYFQCDCSESVNVYMYYSMCKTCNDFTLNLISKLNSCKYVSLNGEEFVRK